VRRSVGVALARDLDDLTAIEEHVGRLGAVAAGDDHDLGAEGVYGAGQRDRAGELGVVVEAVRRLIGDSSPLTARSTDESPRSMYVTAAR